MLTCQALTEIVTDYVEGRMSFWSRLQVQMHLGMCRHCRAYLRQMRETVVVLGHLPAEPMPPDVKTELMKRFAAMAPRPDTPPET